jgi:hypothetical protein
MAFDPSALFGEPRTRPAYATFAAELDAVKSRDKAIAYVAASRRELTARWFRELVDAVLERGLTLAIVPGRASEQLPDAIAIYVLHDDQAWRIPAHRALWATALVDGRWTFAAEAQEGVLLGYSLDDRARALADARWSRAAFDSPTIYALLDAARRRRTLDLGKRCFGDNSDIMGLQLFVHGDNYRLQPSAASRVPKGFTLARAAVDHDCYAALFEPEQRTRRRAVWTVKLAEGHARALNAAMRSNVQFLVGKSWR